MITDSMWYRMCDFNMSRPIPLDESDINKPFVYYRKYGLFYVPSGYHIHAMALLLAFDHDLMRIQDVRDKLKLSHHTPSITSDYFLEHTKGTCYKSSLSDKIYAWSSSHLNDIESDFFGKITPLSNL